MKIRLLASLFVLFFALSALADQTIRYEPVSVQLNGTLALGKFQHPNGRWMPFTYLVSATPVSIAADPANPLYVRETGVKEIQLSSADKTISQRLRSLSGKTVTLTGTVFHAENAWHVRPLIMDVEAIHQ